MTLTISAARHVSRRIEGKDPVEACRELKADCDSALARAKKAAAVTRALVKPKAPGKDRDERKRIEDSREAAGKAAAMKRSEDFPEKPRCEVWDDGMRCVESAVDAHHSLGGTHKKEMEALGGEGFIASCRGHHALLFHGSLRVAALAEVKEHALRHGFKRLLGYVEKARALHDGKHRRSA